MHLNLGTLLGAIAGGVVGFLVAGDDVTQKAHWTGRGVVIGLIAGTLIGALFRGKDSEEGEGD
jgi:uncharacterized protein YqgC (DUF456 family)